MMPSSARLRASQNIHRPAWIVQGLSLNQRFTMRPIIILHALALLMAACNGKSSCELAGGMCEPITPGACLGLFSPNSDQYSCSSGVCCLPLSYTPCESHGGQCIRDMTCANGTVADPKYGCSNTGGATTCCLPSVDGGN